MTRSKRWLAVAALVACACSTAANAQPGGDSSVSVGFDYSSGKYGSDTSTEIWSMPIGYAWRNDRWALRLTVPYLGVSGAGNVIPGLGGTGNSNPRGRGRNGQAPSVPVEAIESSGSASGLGDIVASAAYAVIADSARGFGLDLSGRIKFGTADEDKGLGSGQNDFTLGLDAYQTAGDWTAFGGINYAMLGDSEFLQLDDVFGANVGASRKLGDAASFGVVYDYRQRAAELSDTRRELTAFYNHRIGASAKLQAYVLTGFSDGSPDLGGGLSLSHGF
jgi:hypothetical protein